MKLTNEQLLGLREGMRVEVRVVVTLDRVADSMCGRVNGVTVAIPDTASLVFAPAERAGTHEAGISISAHMLQGHGGAW